VAGYSGTPLPRKLGIKEGHRVAFRSAPPGFDDALGDLPARVDIKRRVVAPVDVAVAFFTRRSALEGRLCALARAVFPDGGLWIAWPKRASGVATDITEDVVRALGPAEGLVDNKLCAIDDTWSGLRLFHRFENRGRRSAKTR
jgi:hypothetical protein